MSEKTPIEERLSVHEAVCAERYGALVVRINWLTYIVGALVFLLLIGDGTVSEVVKRLMGK